MHFFWQHFKPDKLVELEKDWSLKSNADIQTKTATLCCMITTGLFILCYAPYLLYHFRRYYKQHNHIVFKKRKNKITHWVCGLFIFKLFYGAIMYNAFLIYDATSLTFNILLAIDDWVLMVILYFWVWRFYILFFELNWTINVLDNEWMVLLNSSSTQRNWYLMKKKTFGNDKWIFLRYILPLIIISCLLLANNVVLGQLFGNNYRAWGIIQLWGAMIEIIPFIILIFIFCKFKRNQFDDQFFILQELKYIFIALSIDNTANILVFVGTTFLWQNSLFYHIIIPCFAYNVIWGSQFVACVISTKWVNNKVFSIVQFNQYSILRKKLSFGIDESVSSVQFLQINQNKGGGKQVNDSGFSSTSHSGTVSSYTSNKNKELFYKLISKQKGFHAFMLHLSKEFSMETLLFLIEVIQFQNYIKSHCNHDLFSDKPGTSLYEKIVFPPDIPKSDIVYADDFKMNGDNNNNDHILLYSLKIKAIQIYRKYIKPQSELEINISYHGRRILTKLMGHDEVTQAWLINNTNPPLQFKELLDLYDEACNQIFALVIDSFNRFKYTNKYLQLKQFKIF